MKIVHEKATKTRMYKDDGDDIFVQLQQVGCDLRFYKIIDKWRSYNFEIVNVKHLGNQHLKSRIEYFFPPNPENVYIMKIVPIL